MVMLSPNFLSLHILRQVSVLEMTVGFEHKKYVCIVLFSFAECSYTQQEELEFLSLPYRYFSLKGNLKTTVHSSYITYPCMAQFRINLCMHSPVEMVVEPQADRSRTAQLESYRVYFSCQSSMALALHDGTT